MRMEHKEVIGTDESWEVTLDGNYRAAEFYDGETYDATVHLDAVSWHKAARERLKVHPEILAQYGAPVRAHEVFQPAAVTHAPGGEVIYDFGQNFAGVIRARMRGKEGQRVVFRHAEILMDGELFTKPLRTAKQEAVYICRGKEEILFAENDIYGFPVCGSVRNP